VLNREYLPDFAIRFLNADMVEFMANLPWTATRFLAGAALQHVDIAISHS